MALLTGIFTELLTEERAAAADRERRSSLENPQTPLSYPAEWLLDIFNGGRTDSGIRVSEMTAFQVVTFLACVDLIAGKLASLPWHVYEKQVNQHGRAIHRVAYDHEYYDLLHSEPNEEMSWQSFLYAYLVHQLAWPGAYAEVQRDASNGVVALWPRNPGKTRPRRLTSDLRLAAAPWRPFPVVLPAGSLVYETSDHLEEQDLQTKREQPARIIPAADMLHVPGMSFDGRIGQSVVWLARNTLGSILAMEKFGNKYFANFAKPGGILEMPANLSPDLKEQSKRSWQEAQGGENAHRVAMMPPGWKFQAISHNPQEAQTREQREFLRTEIAAAFHVPPRMVGDVNTKTKGSTEQENQELLDFALAPRINAVCQEVKRKLFPHVGLGRTPRNPYHLLCDTWELVRGDSGSREKYYASGRQWGYLSANDVKAREKENPIDAAWAEMYWMPVNMTLATTPVNPASAVGSDAAEPQTVRAYERIWRDAFQRLVGREKRDAHALQSCFGAVCGAIRDEAGESAGREMRSAARPGAESERFVAEYLAGMAKRAAGWSAALTDDVCRSELERAVRAIRVAVYRELAAEKAKEPILIQ